MSQEDGDYLLSAPVCSAKLIHVMNNIKVHQVNEKITIVILTEILSSYSPNPKNNEAS